jgi:SAM-dependent methyltransferase
LPTHIAVAAWSAYWMTHIKVNMQKAMSEAGFSCPSCHRPMKLNAQKRAFLCESCNTSGDILADNLITFLGRPSPSASRILTWPDAEMNQLETLLVNLRRGNTIDAGALNKLITLGLATPDGDLTKLGVLTAYNSSEFVWQSAYDPLEGSISPKVLARGSRVLDLGCGSGQTSRLVFPDFAGTLVGVDCSSENVAYGSKLFAAYGLPGLFCCASAYALPFADNSFDSILCRGAVNYTQQRLALSEAFRVLRPGGFIFLRVENINWDLRALTDWAGALRWIFDLRSMGVGLFHELTGYQPTPGGPLRGPRAYVSERRFRQAVDHLGGEVLRYEPSHHGPKFRGRGTQDVILCQKLGEVQHAGNADRTCHGSAAASASQGAD